ncbi:isoprenyl transferase [Hippea jasoniae]|uniref:isoprenyl transferase n=1 Tax=Hippea jasoniae TaxID=944479 RepID=UPI00054FB440|nr:isoprenyl transferase [Hippea jasoniae]
MVRIPEHVAIIMDGNGRWAQSHGRRRTYGHYIGSKVVDDITKAAVEFKIKYLTLYTFSTENWKRPKSEVRFLMGLLKSSLKKKRKLFKDNNVRFNVIGDVSVFDEIIQNLLMQLMDETKDNEAVVLTLALNYGGKLDILRAAKTIAKRVEDGELSSKDINEKLFEAHLYTANMPDVDLLIRTGGEKRISNFLLWQAAYAEFVFFDKYWPEFTKEDLWQAIEEFSQRKRRFGGL